MRKLIAAAVISLSVLAAAAGSLALMTVTATPVEAKPCRICPLYCIGVTCDDGRTYCNSCLAACAGAHNCTTTGL
jgi:hypothetical protein